MSSVNIESVKEFQEFEKDNQTIFVDFWASWCGPCRMVSPFVDQVAEEYKGKLPVLKVEVEDQRELSERFEILSVPTLVVIKDGEIVDSINGFQPKEKITELIENNINE